MALILAVLYFSALGVSSVRAGGGMTGGSTEFTQIMNNGELVASVSKLTAQLNQQIQMVQDMIQNTMQLPQQFGAVMGMVRNVMNAYNQVQGLLHRLSNIDDEFYRMFQTKIKDLQNPYSSAWVSNYSETYHDMSGKMEEKAQETIKSLKVSADDITDSSEMLDQLATNAGTANGRNAILQAGNDFLGFLGGELVKMRTLLLEQTNTYLQYMERERAIQDGMQDVLKKDIGNWRPPEQTVVEYNLLD
jgi:P-type conjugative transfer protein TrbJ